MEAHVTRRGCAIRWHCHLDATADPAAVDVWITGPPASEDESPDDEFAIEFAVCDQTATIVLSRQQLTRIAVDSNTILAR